jgi:hypothetical protein
MRLVKLAWAALLLSSVLSGCSSTEPRGPVAIDEVLGNYQRGTPGEKLDLPFLIRVTDIRGAAVDDVNVRWTVTSGDGVIDGLWEDCSPLEGVQRGNPATPVSVRTNADGLAWISFEPLWFGPITVQADVGGVDVPVVFNVDGSDADATLSMVAGDGQEGETGVQLMDGFVARLTNGRGDPVPDVGVSWQVASGGGGLSASYAECFDQETDPVTVTARTLADGRTGSAHNGMRFTPRVYGINSVVATVFGVQGSPLTFTIDANVQVIFLWGTESPFEPGFYPSDVTVPIGATVEFENGSEAAHIMSTSVPTGGSSFDSGMLSGSARFRFVPDAAGTWEYVDQVSGLGGALRAQSP